VLYLHASLVLVLEQRFRRVGLQLQQRRRCLLLREGVPRAEPRAYTEQTPLMEIDEITG
jgi:hypothetical protein